MAKVIIYDLASKSRVQREYGFTQPYAFDYPYVLLGEHVLCNLGMKFLDDAQAMAKDLGADLVAVGRSDKPTTVMSVKVACIRPKFDNLKEWASDPDNVYIGRKGIVFVDGRRFPERDSIWANPFKVDKDGAREEVLRKYEAHIRAKLQSGEIPKSELDKLRGKTAGCWCEPEPIGYDPDRSKWRCHGSVLLQLLEEFKD